MLGTELAQKQLGKEKERISGREIIEDRNNFQDSKLGDFKLKLISTGDKQLPECEYVPVVESCYNPITIDMVIRSSHKRYEVNQLGVNNFLVQSSTNNNVIAILNAIELGKKHSCLADYFNDNPRPLKASSPFVDVRIIDRNSATLWNELAPFLQPREVNIQILLPFTVSSNKWMICEINVHKVEKEYQLYFSVHDPYGCYTMFSSECYQLSAIFLENIKKIDKEAIFKKPSCNMSPSPRTINANDQYSSSVIAIEILLTRTTNSNFEQLQEPGAIKLRQAQIQNVMSMLDRKNPRRAAFLNLYATKNKNESRKVGEPKTLIIKYQNEYEPEFQEDDLLYLKNRQTPHVMSINEQAAFHAAKTGNVLLMAALLGINFTDQDNIGQDKAANQMFVLKEDFYQKIYEIEVIKGQISAIEKFIKQPEHLQTLSELKEELEAICEQIASKIILSLEDWLNCRPNAYFRGEKFTFKDISLSRKEQILNDFKEKLLSKKSEILIDLYRWQFDLKTEKERLSTKLKLLENAKETIITEENKHNMIWCRFDMKKKKAEDEHLQIIARIARDKVDNDDFPNFYPRNIQALFEYLYAAKVLVNLRNQENNTLLHVACASGHIGVVKVLLTRGAKIDVKNGLGLTPEQLADNYIQDIISLKNKSYDSFGKESIFMKEIMKFETEYKAHLEKQLRLKQVTIIGWFLNNFILYQRQQKAQKLQKYIGLARKEEDDSALVTHLEAELAEHRQLRGNDTGIFGTSMFFSGIAEILERVHDNQDDYDYVRLSTNIKKATLYYRLQQTELREKETAQKLSEVTIALEQEKENNAKDKQRLNQLEEQLKQNKTEIEQWKKEQEHKYSEDMKAFRTDIMAMLSNQQNSKEDGRPQKHKGIAEAAGEQGIFAPTRVIPIVTSNLNTKPVTEQRPK